MIAENIASSIATFSLSQFMWTRIRVAVVVAVAVVYFSFGRNGAEWDGMCIDRVICERFAREKMWFARSSRQANRAANCSPLHSLSHALSYCTLHVHSYVMDVMR